MTDENGGFVRYTSEFDKANNSDSYVYINEFDSSGNEVRRTHERGAPVYDSTGNVVTLEASQLVTLLPQRYVGNEPQIWYGGELSYYESDDVQIQSLEVQRISGLGIPGDVYFASGVFGAADSTADVNDILQINLGAGDDAFTVNETPESGLVINLGAGDDRIGVRTVVGALTINAESGDDQILIGSQAGFWDIGADDGERPAYVDLSFVDADDLVCAEADPCDPLGTFINAQGSLNWISESIRKPSTNGQ